MVTWDGLVFQPHHPREKSPRETTKQKPRNARAVVNTTLCTALVSQDVQEVRPISQEERADDSRWRSRPLELLPL